mmetsp:Transcript_5405/g.16133  ORF Transcript_5405/g.16133 Transcript_5405/m.16133 type:complete len:479 (+) Transcript_5405:159-1595(+)
MVGGGGHVELNSSTSSMDDWVGETGEMVKDEDRLSKGTMIGMASGMLGVQFCWSIQIGYVTKALLELGLARQYVALAWLAGPIAGIIVQPIVGWYSDRSTSRFGRRRPYICAGVLLSLVNLVFFGYGDRIGMMLGDSDDKHPRGIFVSILAFWLLDFSINAAQGPLRTLLVDLAPPSQQSEGNTYLALMTSLGNFLGSLAGSFNLQTVLPFFHNDVSAIYCFGVLVLFTTTVTCCLVSQEKPATQEDIDAMTTNADGQSTTIMQACMEAPGTYWRVYAINCFTWFAWFTLFIYGTSWVGAEVLGGDATAPEGDEKRAIYDNGVRLGNLGFSLQSIIAVVYSIALRYLLQRFGKLGPYIFSQTIQAVCLLATVFVRKAVVAIILFATLGICWSNSMAVPWAIVGELTGRNSPEYAGMYVTIFNSSQAFPEVIVSLLAQWIVRITGSQTVVLVMGGVMGAVGAMVLCFSPLDLPVMDPYF